MKLFLILSLMVTSIQAATWKAGEESFELTQDSQEDWATSGCLKECEMDRLASKILQTTPLKPEDLSGGKNPGSVLCRKILGQVIYLEQGEDTDAFCRLGDQIVSLSRITRISLK
jgi:hypothetical protein